MRHLKKEKSEKQVAHIDGSMCDKSPMCPPKKMCPAKAISQEKGTGIFGFLSRSASKVNESLCIGCKICVNYCPHGAIKMVNKK